MGDEKTCRGLDGPRLTLSGRLRNRFGRTAPGCRQERCVEIPHRLWENTRVNRGVLFSSTSGFPAPQTFPREVSGAVMNTRRSGALPPGGAGNRWYHPIWRDLPLWFVFGQLLYLTYLMLTIPDPPRIVPALSGFAPLVWFLIAFLTQCRRKAGSPPAGRRTFWWGGIVLVMIVAPYLIPPLITDGAAMKVLFEIDLYLITIVMALHCLKTRGRWDLLSIFGVGLLYGIVLENSGIWMGFFEEPGYLYYLPGLPAPPATMFGWSFSFYLAVWIAHFIAPKSAWPVKAMLATGVILSVDLQGDSAASIFQWWLWPESFSHRLFDVPLINFIAWAGAVLPFAGAYFLIRSREGGADWRRPVRLFAAMPVVLMIAACMVLILTGLLLGFDSPEMNLFKKCFAATGLFPSL